MSKYLCQTQETYRVDTETEVKRIIEDAKNDNQYTLIKYTSEYKERKQKGEIIDEYYKLILTKHFNDIKEPDATVNVYYEVEEGVFPSAVDDDYEGEF